MAPGDGGHDEWKLAALDVRVLDPLGNLLCDQDITANPGPLADLKNGSTTMPFSTPNCATTAPPTAWDSIEFQIRTGNDDAGDGRHHGHGTGSKPPVLPETLDFVESG